MAAPSATTIDTGEIFRLRNDSTDTELVIPALSPGGRTWTVAPGKSALVPFEVIRVWWGDPRSRPEQYTKFSDSKERGWINKREDEIRRLGVLYGSYSTDVDSLLNPDYPRGHVEYGSPKRVPHPISVQTEAGETVVPACFDTSGTAVYGAVRTDSEDLNDQVAYQAHVERQLDTLREELARLKGDQGMADDAGVDIPGQ
jgi:hypothetical protein